MWPVLTKLSLSKILKVSLIFYLGVRGLPTFQVFGESFEPILANFYAIGWLFFSANVQDWKVLHLQTIFFSPHDGKDLYIFGVDSLVNRTNEKLQVLRKVRQVWKDRAEVVEPTEKFNF